MSELDHALEVLTRTLDGMIRRAIREEIVAVADGLRQGGSTSTDPEWMTPEMVARRLGISSVTVYAWRAAGKGPPSVKIGRLVRYKTANVDAWAEGRLSRKPASKAGRSS